MDAKTRIDEQLEAAAHAAAEEAASARRSLNNNIRRMLVVAMGAAFFLGIGSLIRPKQSGAQTAPPAPSPLDDDTIRIRELQHSPIDPKGTDPQDLPLIQRIKERGTTAIATAAPKHPRGLSVLGQLRGANYHTWIYGSDEGPRYTVCDTKGVILLEDLAAGDVYREFPNLDIKGMVLPADVGGGPGEPLMMHDAKE